VYPPPLFSWNLPGNDMKKKEIERIFRWKTTRLQRDDNGCGNGTSTEDVALDFARGKRVAPAEHARGKEGPPDFFVSAHSKGLNLAVSLLE
jgi:hypothetical protein